MANGWEITAILKPGTATPEMAQALTNAAGRIPDDTRGAGPMWIAKDVGEANRLFVRLIDSGLCKNVERYKRKATMIGAPASVRR